jgi:hypothetical protein
MFTSNDSTPIAIDFLNRPHYFQQTNVIVVYTEANREVISLLRETFDAEFAGDASTPLPGGDYANPVGRGR